MIEQMSYELWLKCYRIEPEIEDCTECHGDGTIQCDCCKHVEDCGECGATGKIDVTRTAYDGIHNAERRLIEFLTKRKEV